MIAFDPIAASEEIAEVIRHELIHSQQLRKQAEKKGISIRSAEKERRHDKNQIYVGNDSEKYLSLTNEIDAFAHQIAEELLRKYGKRSLEILSMSMDNPDMPEDVKEFAPLKKIQDPKIRKRLKSRIFSYLKKLAATRERTP